VVTGAMTGATAGAATGAGAAAAGVSWDGASSSEMIRRMDARISSIVGS
jgi:hypothetical protein